MTRGYSVDRYVISCPAGVFFLFCVLTTMKIVNRQVFTQIEQSGSFEDNQPQLSRVVVLNTWTVFNILHCIDQG